MDKPHYIEDLTKELSHFRDDFNDHVIDDKEWKINHEKADLAAFKDFKGVQQLTNESIADLKSGLQGLYTAQGEMIKELQGIREDIKYGKWIFDGSKGVALIPKSLWIALLLIAIFTVFGFKAVLSFIIGLIK
jgi:hypothetical protein